MVRAAASVSPARAWRSWSIFRCRVAISARSVLRPSISSSNRSLASFHVGLERRDLGLQESRPVGLAVAPERLQRPSASASTGHRPARTRPRPWRTPAGDRPARPGAARAAPDRPRSPVPAGRSARLPRSTRPVSLQGAIRALGHQRRCRHRRRCRCHGRGPFVHRQERQRLQLSGLSGKRGVGGLAVGGRQGAGREEDCQEACHNQPPFWMDETGRNSRGRGEIRRVIVASRGRDQAQSEKL